MTTTSEGGEPKEVREWKPAAESALEKATNLSDQYKWKLAKSDEIAIRGKQEMERCQQGLEVLKKLKLSQDTSLPKATKMMLNEKDPQKIKLRIGTISEDVDYSEGWRTRVGVTVRVLRLRSQKDVIFVTL